MTTMVGHRIDDNQLLSEAVEPPKPLLPLLRQADAMFPLVLMLAVLPPLYAMQQQLMTEGSALWGLRGLQCLRATNLDEMADPPVTGSASSLRWQPPLMTWLTALGMSVLTPTGNYSLLVGAVLGTTALMLACHLLSLQMGGYRLSVLVVLLLAFQPEILRLAQQPTPHAMGMTWGCLCLWMFLSHMSDNRRVVSVKLLFSGLSLGLCLLTSGPLAVAFYLVLVLHVVWLRVAEFLRARSDSRRGTLFQDRRTAFRSLMLLGATAFAVGGWWELMMGARYGAAFWQGWLSGTPSSDAVFPGHNQDEPTSWLSHVHLLSSPLFWLALLGVWETLRSMIQLDNDSRVRRRGLLVVWMFVAGAIWLVGGNTHQHSADTQPAVQVYFLAPWIFFAAVGILAIVDRRVAFPIALAVLLLSISEMGDVATFWNWNLPASVTDSGRPTKTSNLFVLMLFLVIGAATFYFIRRDSARQRVVLTTLLLLTLSGSSLWGANRLRRTTPTDRQWKSLQTALGKINEVNRCTLACINSSEQGPTRAPPIVRFLVESSWPNATISEVAEWEAVASEFATEKTPDHAHLVVAWGMRGRLKPPPTILPVRGLGPTHFLDRLEIAIYTRASDETGLSFGRTSETDASD